MVGISSVGLGLSRPSVLGGGGGGGGGSGNHLLLADGVSDLLLSDGSSFLLLAVTSPPVTWDPLNKASTVTLSNSNLTAAVSGGADGIVRSTTNQSSGKYYFEFVPTVSGTRPCIGFIPMSGGLNTFLGSGTSGGTGIFANGEVYYNNLPLYTSQSFVSGNVLGIAIDVGAGKWYVNNWTQASGWKGNGAADPVAGTGGNPTGVGVETPFIAVGNQSGSAGTLRITSDSWTGTCPSGYSQWTSPTLLLDALSVAPKAAFSTRKLRADYAGAALRVRSSSGGAEADIGFVGEHLDTASLASFIGSNSAYVVRWYDQSTNGTNATTSSNSRQPEIVSTGALHTVNARACMTFNNPNKMDIGASIAGTTLSSLVVATLSSGAMNYARLATSWNGVGHDYDQNACAVLFYRNALTAQIASSRDPNAGGFSTTIGYDVAFQAGVVYTGSMQTTYLNSVEQSSIASTGTFAIGGVYIGATEAADAFWSGNVCELIVFGSALGSTDLGVAYSNQKAYWGTL